MSPDRDRSGVAEALVTCPLCLRERPRMQTFITHVCTEQIQCYRHARAERDRYRDALERLRDEVPMTLIPQINEALAGAA